MISLFFIAVSAAFVNGALGYGFSSITVPLALLFLTNKALNPAIVLLEVALNLVALFANRRSIAKVWPKLKVILVGMVPTIILGSYFLGFANPSMIKLGTYGVLLPLLFLQVVGRRFPMRLDGPLGWIFGSGLGFLYSMTTISGPPLALLFNNHGMEKEEFRAALATVRVFESVLTAASYFALKVMIPESGVLAAYMFPAVLIGIPAGAWLIRKVDAEVFRRICMSFDILIVAFGLSRCLQDLKLIEGPAAYSVLAAIALLNLALLFNFFRTRGRGALGRV